MSERHQVYKSARFSVTEEEVVSRGGSRYTRAVVVHPGAVVVLPLLPDGRVAMIENRRPAVGKTLLELPAGTLEPGESPLHCAARELVEETGYEAGKLWPLVEFYSSPGFTTERMYAFVAEELTEVGQDLDETEQIEVRPMGVAELQELIRDGRVEDGKTLATLLRWLLFER